MQQAYELLKATNEQLNFIELFGRVKAKGIIERGDCKKFSAAFKKHVKAVGDTLQVNSTGTLHLLTFTELCERLGFCTGMKHNLAQSAQRLHLCR
eukprot:357120-Chlamydomonas_euryale.AAC.4